MIEYQNKYLSDVAELRMRSVKYTGDNLEIPTSIDPALLESHRETVFVYHDESTVHANERPRLLWLLPNTAEFRLKSEG